jgi:polysaccharide deacetylase 2 family uncharacterized protein YibQ
MRIKILSTIFVITTLVLAILIGLKFKNFRNIIDSLPHHFFSTKHTLGKKFSDNNTQSTTTDGILEILYKQLEIKPESVNRIFSPDDSLLSISLEVPRGKPMEWIIWLFTSSLEKTGYSVENCTYISDERGCTIQFISKKHSAPELHIKINRGKLYYSKTAKMAFIIEDFRFNADQPTIDILSFNNPLTLSMRAEKKLATSTAQIANEYKKEIVLLQPMEPIPKTKDDLTTQLIMVHYSDDKIRSILRESVQNIPQFKGLCNYHGGRVLDDSHAMSIICDEIKKENGFLVISTDNRMSNAPAIAKEAHLSYVEVDFSFSVNQTGPGIIDSLRLCAILAQKKGTLLVKGHPTPHFIGALKQALPIFENNGIQLVYVSELIKSIENQKDISKHENHDEKSSGK